MTTAQLATFRSFYKTDLADGALSFDWVDPFDGATTRSLRIERYSLTTNGASHFLTLNMEVLP